MNPTSNQTNPHPPQEPNSVSPEPGRELREQKKSPSDEWLEIGTIVAPQGLKGEMRVYPKSDFPERFTKRGQRFLKRPGETQPQPVELLGGRFIPGKGIYAVKLVGVDTCEQAEALRDYVLMVSASDRPKLAKDEYHVLDLIDLEVFDQLTGEAIGFVIDVIPAGHQVLEVKLHHQPEVAPPKAEAPIPNRISKKRKPKRQQEAKPATVLIPFVMDIAPVVDLQNRRIEITPPPGLLEINES